MEGREFVLMEIDFHAKITSERIYILEKPPAMNNNVACSQIFAKAVNKTKANRI
jgi:hypothetical protein